MRTIRLLFTLFAIWLTTSCTKDQLLDDQSQATRNGSIDSKSKPSQVKIGVLSDIHYMAPELLLNGAENGEAFQAYLAYDPKLLQFSDPIFRTALSKIQREKPDILLIPGDLTKDGEAVSHEAVAGILQQVIDNGTKVYVIPGNHDINNPEARQYNGNESSATPSITAAEFSTLYKHCGYDEAIYKDAYSRSYISQPFTGLWILAIDDCKYYDNTDIAIVSGVIRDETMSWILQKLDEARANNITVLGMMHHGIVEHFMGQNAVDPGYVTDNWQVNVEKLANAGLKIMFTGHYHANDITMWNAGGKKLVDVETGSLVTPPSPYRMVIMDGKGMSINTTRITSINCTLPMGFSFTHYSKQFLTAHLDGYFTMVLEYLYGVPAQYAIAMAPLFRNGWMAHYAGDENITPPEQAADNQVPDLMLKGALQGIWTDLPPVDNRVRIDW